MVKRLIVVSNRVAPIKNKASAGGLSVALQAALQESGGLWFGWNGVVSDSVPDEPSFDTEGGVTYVTTGLSRTEHDGYYQGYANRTLWPLFHYRVDLAVFERGYYEHYEAVNARFARCLAPLLRPDDILWVHDYHLIPLGEELRKIGYTGPLGFFLHIPFPVPEILRALYNHKRLVRHLLAFDLIGLQTERDVGALSDYAIQEMGGTVSADGLVRAYGNEARIGAFPIGIDTENFAQLAVSAPARRHSERMTQSLGGRQLIIGIDRLDYSKGLPERLQAYQKLLQQDPEISRRVTLVQIAAASRAEVPEYRELRRQLATLTGEINGQYAEFDSVPIRYINRAYGRRAVAGMLRVAKVGLVTPLRDGMNLVAKEYVAAQDPDDPGVLVLSRFAGAAAQLTDALIVNPYDVQEVADTVQQALQMPLEERRRRWAAMMKAVTREDVTAWRQSFVTALLAASRS